MTWLRRFIAWFWRSFVANVLVDDDYPLNPDHQGFMPLTLGPTPGWQAEHEYANAELVANGSSQVFRAEVDGSGTSDSVEPSWSNDPGFAIIDGELIWWFVGLVGEFRNDQAPMPGVLQDYAQIDPESVALVLADPVMAWQATHVYDTGARILETSADGTFIYEVVNDGTSGGAEPDWLIDPDDLDQWTFTDGTVTWVRLGREGELPIGPQTGQPVYGLPLPSALSRLARAAETGLYAVDWNGWGFNGQAASRPEIPATPTEQDIVDALVTLGLVTQAAP